MTSTEMIKCKSGRHDWVEENIYEAPNRSYRCCKVCVRESARQRRARGLDKGFVQAAALPKDQPEHHRALTAAELRYLRSLIPCMGCGQTPKEDGCVRHWPGCSVSFIREGDGRSVGRPRKPRAPRVVRCCLVCNTPMPNARGNNKLCSENCRQVRAARRAEAYRSARSSRKSVAS